MSNVIGFPVRHSPPLSKKQLAAELNRSPRWIELRVREGLPMEPRANPSEHARFDLAKVRAWLDARAEKAPMTLEQRVEALERQVAQMRKAS